MFETQGGTRNRTRDLPKKGSAFITSSDHWTCAPASSPCLCSSELSPAWALVKSWLLQSNPEQCFYFLALSPADGCIMRLPASAGIQHACMQGCRGQCPPVFGMMPISSSVPLPIYRHMLKPWRIFWSMHSVHACAPVATTHMAIIGHRGARCPRSAALQVPCSTGTGPG